MSLHLPLRQACGGVIGVITELQGRNRDRRQNELLKSSPRRERAVAIHLLNDPGSPAASGMTNGMD